MDDIAKRSSNKKNKNGFWDPGPGAPGAKFPDFRLTLCRYAFTYDQDILVKLLESVAVGGGGNYRTKQFEIHRQSPTQISTASPNIS